MKTRLGLAPRGLSVFWLSRRLIRLPGGTFSVFRERADKRETINTTKLGLDGLNELNKISRITREK